ncbi:TPA: MFS transporter [Legionella pneumophila]|nr:MFS transporter [Legionella pneumophila]
MKHRTRIILAGMTGNLVETFDMAICGLLSVYLAKYLIGDSSKGLLIVFATFFAGYLARPLGAAVLGLFSDIYGRKITLAASILSMGISTTLIGFIPPNSSIGIASMIILLILRIIQSFSCGAEYLNSSAYLIENAEESHKGYSGSWASFGSMSGLLLASIITLIITYFTSTYPEHDWFIWRIPFVLALFGSSIGLYIRIFIPESMEYIMYYAKHPKPGFKSLISQAFHYIKDHKLKSLYVFILSCLGVTTTFQIYIYGPTQAHIYGHFSDHQIIASNIISLIVLLCVFPIIGKLSDKVNREKIVISASIGFILLSQPFFYLLSYGSYKELVAIHALIAIPAGAYYATVPVMLAEMFPLNLRCTVLSVLYSTAASLAAGLTPLLSLLLLKKYHNALSPTILVFVLAISVLGIMYLKNIRFLKYNDSKIHIFD